MTVAVLYVLAVGWAAARDSLEPQQCPPHTHGGISKKP